MNQNYELCSLNEKAVVCLADHMATRLIKVIFISFDSNLILLRKINTNEQKVQKTAEQSLFQNIISFFLFI